MIRSFVYKATSVATLSFAAAVTAGAQAPANVLNIVGNARISSTGAGAGFPTFIDFLSGGFPPSVIGNGVPGNVNETAVSGVFAGVAAGAQGTIQDLQISGDGSTTTTNPATAAAAASFMTIGGYTFTLTGAPAGTSGVSNFGPISLDANANGTSATFGVNGFVTGPGFTQSTAYRGIFSADFVGQTPDQVFTSINTGGTPTVSFRASFTATPAASTVPEPSTYALLATGMGALGLVARRRRTNA